MILYPFYRIFAAPAGIDAVQQRARDGGTSRPRNYMRVLLAAAGLLASAHAQADKYSARTFTYGKYYALDPESPGTKSADANS
jgi:hypothetical protein